MASNTSNYNLYKKDPVADASDTFNIKTMLNDNWDIIDATIASKVSIISGTGIITTNGWTANSGDYPFKLDVAIAGILSTDSVDAFINNDDLDLAGDAELSLNNDSYDGGITFYCKTIPTSPIGFAYRGLR